MTDFDAAVERIALGMSVSGDAEKSASLALMTLQAAAEVIAASCGPREAAKACYVIADFFACFPVENGR
jgi:hypothetical protein